jgi:sigma-70-like protein
MGDVIQLVAVKRCLDCGLMKRVGEGGEFYRMGRYWASRCKSCDNTYRGRRQHVTAQAVEPIEAGEPASYEQVAAALGMTVTGVRQLEERALRKLRRRPGALREWRP